MIELPDFEEFFLKIHGVRPFPWQERLCEVVVNKGWPRALDVPTGAGKTAAIDVAVFHLALEASRSEPQNERGLAAARRIFFIVDRRLVVDDAYERALKISRALKSSTDGVLKRIAAALLSLQMPSQNTEKGLSTMLSAPLRVARLRGGVPRDSDWVRSPNEAVVSVSTVDQVGSRLLFRGYGVSDTMKPVHAGLVGSDALYLLDEAHLSRPFVETVKSVLSGDERRRVPNVVHYVQPFRVVTLSATQSSEAEPLISDADREHEVLGRRLAASKPTTLVLTEADADSIAFNEEMVEQALNLSVLCRGDAITTCIIVNRVRRAREVFEALSKRLRLQAGGPAVAHDVSPLPHLALLIGRTRELARHRLLVGDGDGALGLLARMRAPGKEESRIPLIVVATQCVEAGADLDFDALVSEIAPLDCLRQRFGRLNRTGRSIPAKAVIIAAPNQIGARARPDPIYGDSAAKTWGLLQQNSKKAKDGRGLIDFGLAASEQWLPSKENLQPFLAPTRDPLVVLPAFLDQWSRTSPIPTDDPEVGLFLHGVDAGPADVQIIWRADLEDQSPDGPDGLEQNWMSRVSACPPSSLETLSVPFSEALRWLTRHNADADIADIEGCNSPVDDGRSALRHPVLRWCGEDDAGTCMLWREPRLFPGDTIVVPAKRGGCDVWGWNPTSRARVDDLADEANQRHRGRSVLRLSAELLRTRLERRDIPRKLGELETFVRRSPEWNDREVRERVSDLPSELCSRWFENAPERLRLIEVLRDKQDVVVALAYRTPSLEGEMDEPAGDATTETDRSVEGSQRSVTLCEHSGGVQSFASVFGQASGLPRSVVEDIRLAGLLHDAGKAHPNFKVWLYAGDLGHELSEPLAKSAHRRLGSKARKLAGLPQCARHEVASVIAAVAHPALAGAHDSELVLWLIGTHHGRGRPFLTEAEWPREDDVFPVKLDDGRAVDSAPAPPVARLQAEWFDLRQRLHARYGIWGLARLEAILRLADHRQSEWEQDNEAADLNEGEALP